MIIESKTQAEVSNPFRVTAGESVSVKAWGLAGGETVTIQIERGDGEFQDVLDGVLTATAYQQRIISEGLYRLSKSATAGAAGASAG